MVNIDNIFDLFGSDDNLDGTDEVRSNIGVIGAHNVYKIILLFGLLSFMN